MRRVFGWIVVLASGALLTVVALAVAAYLAFAFVPAIGTPSIDAFHESLADETGGIADGIVGNYRCESLGSPRAWRCEVSDPSHSSAAIYRMETRGRRCWEARRLSGPNWDSTEPPPRRARGCVVLGDQFWGS